MANAYTSVYHGGTGTGLGTNLIQTGYETLVDFQLRSTPLFRRAAVGKRASALTNPGTTVVFDLYADLTPNTTNITNDETILDSVAIPETSTVSVTLNEFGKTVIDTLKLRTFTFSDIDPAVANLVARDMAESLDLRVRGVMDASTHRYASVAAGSLATTAVGSLADGTNEISSKAVAAVTTLFRRDNVVESAPMNTFWGFIHPDVSYDLQMGSAVAGTWRYPHENVAPENLWLGQVGVFQGISFVETPRVKTDTDGDSSNVVYRSYFLGAQALAEVMAVEPHLIVGPVTDAMQRFFPLSWYGIGGWSIYRNEALIRLESTATLSSLS